MRKHIDVAFFKSRESNKKQKKIIVYKDGDEFLSYSHISSLIDVLGFDRQEVLDGLKSNEIKKRGYSFIYRSA